MGDNVLVTATDGESINRGAAAPAGELCQVIAREGTAFFNELERVCPY